MTAARATCWTMCLEYKSSGTMTPTGSWYQHCKPGRMPQPTTRNKARKRQTQKRRPNRGREVGRSYRAESNRSKKEARQREGRSRVPEMPEEQAKARTGRVGESHAVIVSPTGTNHRP